MKFQLMLLTLILTGGVCTRAHADTIEAGSLSWSNIFTSSTSTGPYDSVFVQPTGSGFSSDNGYEGIDGWITRYDYSTQFTVTTARGFDLSSESGLSDYSNSCNYRLCGDSQDRQYTLSGDLSSEVTIEDSNNNDIFGESLDATGSSLSEAPPCNSIGFFAGCFADLSVGQSVPRPLFGARNLYDQREPGWGF
jgi:hypothetical protein